MTSLLKFIPISFALAIIYIPVTWLCWYVILIPLADAGIASGSVGMGMLIAAILVTFVGFFWILSRVLKAIFKTAPSVPQLLISGIMPIFAFCGLGYYIMSQVRFGF